MADEVFNNTVKILFWKLIRLQFFLEMTFIQISLAQKFAVFSKTLEVVTGPMRIAFSGGVRDRN